VHTKPKSFSEQLFNTKTDNTWETAKSFRSKYPSMKQTEQKPSQPLVLRENDMNMSGSQKADDTNMPDKAPERQELVESEPKEQESVNKSSDKT
jgi:hypothetical protein